jgi:cell division protein FtsB
MKNNNENTKRFSIFNVLVALIVIAVITALFINNIIHVNQLTSVNNELRKTLSDLTNSNDAMKTDIEKMITFEKINLIAGDKLKMKLTETSSEKEAIIIKKSELE